jgi:hypothetical protein
VCVRGGGKGGVEMGCARAAGLNERQVPVV